MLPLTKRVKLIGIEKKVNEYTISMFEIEEDEIDRVFFRIGYNNLIKYVLDTAGE